MANEIKVWVRLKDLLSGPWKTAGKTVKVVATKMRTAMAGIKNTLFSLKGAFLAFGGAMIAKSFISAASELENFRVQLVAVMDGNRELAEQTLGWVRKFAEVTPHMTQDVVQAFVQLKAVGIEVNKTFLTAMGDASFIFQRNIADVSSALIGLETEVLRRLGIQLDRTGKKAVIMSGNMRIETTKDLKSIRDAVIELWSKRFPGAMKDAENTWSGMISLLKSTWWEFRVSVMEAGVFEMVKKGIGSIIEKIKVWSKDGSMKEWINDLAKAAIVGIGGAVKALHFMYKAINKIQIAWEIASNAFGEGNDINFRHVKGQLDYWHERMVTYSKEMKQLQKEGVENTPGGQTTFDYIQRQVDEASIKVKEFALLVDSSLGVSQEARTKIFDLTDAQDSADRFVETLLAGFKEIEKGADGGRYFKVVDVAEERAKRLLASYKETTAEIKNTYATISSEEEEQTKERNKQWEKFLEFYNKLNKSAKKYKEEQEKLSEGAKRWNATLQGVADVVETHIVNAFDKLLDGEVTRMQDMVRGILKDVARMAVQMAVKTALKAVVSIAAAAQGGVFKGGLGSRTPMRSLAGGGTTRGPEVALIGEGKHDEAVIPMPSGKVPVELKGGGGGPNITFNIAATDAGSFNAQLSRSDSHLRGLINEAFLNSPSFGRA